MTAPSWDATHAPYCATCHMSLEEITDSFLPGVTRYQHPLPVLRYHGEMGVAGHEPQPVRLQDLNDPIILCDFDSVPPARYVYVCAEADTTEREVVARHVKLGDYREHHGAARVHRVETGSRRTINWGTRWAACEGCAALIEARDLLALVRRVADVLCRSGSNAKLVRIRGVLLTMYGQMLATMEPRRLRIEPGHPFGVPDDGVRSAPTMPSSITTGDGPARG